MIDIKLIREKPDEVKRLLLNKEVDASDAIDRIIELDILRRDTIARTEAAKAEQNKISKQIPAMKKAGEDVSAVIQKLNLLKETIKSSDSKLKEIENEYMPLMLGLPNLPDPDLKPGGKENNEPIRYFGEPHKFDFTPKNHVDLCTDLGLIDYQRGVKLSGSGFWVYRGMGCLLYTSRCV